MKKITMLLLALLLAWGTCSCSAARKPATPQTRTIIVPEVSRISFDTLDLKSAPKVIRDMARVVENQDSTFWAQSGNNVYVVVSSGKASKKYDITVDEMLQRLPEQGFNWIDVKLKYKNRTVPYSKSEPVFTVARAAVSSPPSGVSFTISGQEASPSTAENTPLRGTPKISQAPNTPPASSIETPAPNQTITSPVTIKGKAISGGQKRIRLTTGGGQIIKEAGLSPDESGSFNLSMSYSPPEMPVTGEIDLIAIRGGDEKTIARVPVVIK